MNEISKLTLSAEEQLLVNNAGWILTKRVIIDKVYRLFGDLAAAQKKIIEKETVLLPEAVRQSTAKISKGENYLQLPYILLDYPRCFEQEDSFAVRTMFWWGNFFSVSLQLSGKYKLQFQEQLSADKNSLVQNSFYICTNESQWHHHFANDNYTAVRELNNKEMEDIIRQKEFIKLAVKFPLQQWDEMPLLLERSYANIIDLLKA